MIYTLSLNDQTPKRGGGGGMGRAVVSVPQMTWSTVRFVTYIGELLLFCNLSPDGI